MDHLSASELVQSVRAQAALRLKFGLLVAVSMLAAVAWWGAARPENQAWEVGGVMGAYLAYNLIALPLAASGHVSPWMAALGMAGSSLLVTLNALRLARLRVTVAGA